MEGVKIMLRSPFKESALHQSYANTTLHTMQILLYNIGQKLPAVHYKSLGNEINLNFAICRP